MNLHLHHICTQVHLTMMRPLAVGTLPQEAVLTELTPNIIQVSIPVRQVIISTILRLQDQLLGVPSIKAGLLTHSQEINISITTIATCPVIRVASELIHLIQLIKLRTIRDRQIVLGFQVKIMHLGLETI